MEGLIVVVTVVDGIWVDEMEALEVAGVKEVVVVGV
jgi:hypothetical protein